jgi:hypothetical protein
MGQKMHHRSWSAKTVMLTVSALTYPSKTVTFNNTLETFTFGGTDYVNIFTFSKKSINFNFVTEFQITFENREFSEKRFGVVPAFLKWPCIGFVVCFSFLS